MRNIKIGILPPDRSLHPRGMLANGRGSARSAVEHADGCIGG